MKLLSSNLSLLLCSSIVKRKYFRYNCPNFAFNLSMTQPTTTGTGFVRGLNVFEGDTPGEL